MLFLVDKAEEGGLHAISQQYEKQRHVGVNIGNDAVSATFRRQFCRVQRHKQVVEKPPYDAAQTVYCRLLG